MMVDVATDNNAVDMIAAREVPVVKTTLALGMSIEDFVAQRDELTRALAMQYDVDESLITLDIAAGSISIIVTIAISPLASRNAGS